MFDKIIYKIEQKENFFLFLTIIFFLTITIATLNQIIKGDLFTLILLLSLTLAYPTVKQLKNLERKDIEKINQNKQFLKTIEKEFKLFWFLFISLTISLIIYFSFNKLENPFIIKTLIGNFYNINSKFLTILLNNLIVWSLTFLICILISSGLILILTLNSSILALFLHSNSTKKDFLNNIFLIFGHTFFEISGYIIIGLTGFLISYRIQKAYSSKYYFQYSKEENKYIKKKDRRNTFNKIINKNFFFDIGILILISLLCIFIGAILEIL